MKAAPSFMAAVTAAAALGAGALLATEDRMLFEPQQAMLAGAAEDLGSLWGDGPLVNQRPASARAGAAVLEVRRNAGRAGSGVQERR